MNELQKSLATTMGGLRVSHRPDVDHLLQTAAVRKRRQSWLLAGTGLAGVALLCGLVTTKLREGRPPGGTRDLSPNTVRFTDVLPSLISDTWARVLLAVAVFATLVTVVAWYRRRKIARPIPRGVVAVLLVVGGLVAMTIGVRLSIQIYYAPTPSMEPTISTGSRFVVAKHDRDVERGDVVVYARDSQSLTFDRVARVVGVAGDTVQGKGGQLLINGLPAGDFPLSPDRPLPDFAATTVPEDSLFVMGDNYGFATDSRTEGTISSDDLRGTARWATNGWDD